MLKLLGSTTSPYVRKVRLVLGVKHRPYEFIQDALLGDTPTILQFNPLGRIPALLSDDGQVWYDSPVIAEYLDYAYPENPIFPKEWPNRMIVKRWEALADGILDSAVGVLLEKRRPATEQSASYISRHQTKVANGLEMLANDLSARIWCFGHELTLADLAVGTCLLWLEFRQPEIEWRTQYPVLDQYTRKLMQLHVFQTTAPV